MLLRHRSWLLLATLVALASCDLNPQPVLPAERVADSPTTNGGSKPDLGAQDPGTDAPGSNGSGGEAAVEVPTMSGGGAGGDGTAGASGESAGGAGAGESSGGAAGAPL